MQFPRPGNTRNIGSSESHRNTGPGESAALFEAVSLFLETVSGISESLDMIALYYEKKGRLEGLITDRDFLPDPGVSSGK